MKGILFKDEMVRPILNTSPDVWPAQPIDASKPFKWQTRRRFPLAKDRGYPPMRMQERDGVFSLYAANSGSSALPEAFAKPKYNVGEIIYVKEVFTFYKPTMLGYFRADMQYWDHKKNQPMKCCGEPEKCKWTSSLLMPATAARLWLKVMNVRVERVKDMGMSDVQAEGLSMACQRPEYASLYNRINGPGSFDRDWCFVYELKRVSKP